MPLTLSSTPKPRDQWTTGDVITCGWASQPHTHWTHAMLIVTRSNDHVTMLSFNQDTPLRYDGIRTDKLYPEDQYVCTLTEPQLALLHQQLQAQLFPNSLP